MCDMFVFCLRLKMCNRLFYLYNVVLKLIKRIVLRFFKDILIDKYL